MGVKAPDSFTYTMVDSQGATATATVTITINGVTLFIGDTYKLDGEDLELAEAWKDGNEDHALFLSGDNGPALPAYFIDREDGSIRESDVGEDGLAVPHQPHSEPSLRRGRSRVPRAPLR